MNMEVIWPVFFPCEIAVDAGLPNPASHLGSLRIRICPKTLLSSLYASPLPFPCNKNFSADTRTGTKVRSREESLGPCPLRYSWNQASYSTHPQYTTRSQLPQIPAEKDPI